MPHDHLLMIPGPIEISERVRSAAAEPPLSHVAPLFRQSMGRAIASMRAVWGASSASQPFIVAGSGTLAMEMAAHNLLASGETAVVVNTGVFGDRMSEMLRRRGVQVHEVTAPVGEVPTLDAVREALDAKKPQALFATYVDTSTGVRVDAEGLAALAREAGALSIFDGVCATAAERFEMEAWGADVYYTASQKAIGLPAGLALLVASPRALDRRERLSVAPALSVDWMEWIPIMKAYEEDRPAYFSTPATTLVRALDEGLQELLEDGNTPAAAREAIFDRHQRVADGFRRAWSVLGLDLVPTDAAISANTLSALRFPDGIDGALLGAIGSRGVVVAGGLHAELKTNSFRVGHMGEVTRHPDQIERCVRAVGEALRELGRDVDVDAAVAATR